MQAVQSSRDSPSHNLSSMNEVQKRYHQIQEQQHSNPLLGRTFSQHMHLSNPLSGNDLGEYPNTWDVSSHLYYHPVVSSHHGMYHQVAGGAGITSSSNGSLLSSSNRVPSHTHSQPNVAAHSQQATGGNASGGGSSVSSHPHVVSMGHPIHPIHPHHHTGGYPSHVSAAPGTGSTQHAHHHHKRHHGQQPTQQPTQQQVNNLQLARSPASAGLGYGSSGLFCDVWQHNFMEGIRLLRYLSAVYSHVAVDTEFPGIVAKVNHDYMDASEQAYQNIRINLNMLKPIQIGFSFMNDGAVTQENHCTTVQFNMRWDLDGDTHAIDSIRLLEDSGIDFQRLKTEGILADEFAAELIGTGAVLNSNLKHIGYHSAYDWAYLLKLLTGWTELPDSYAEYHDMLKHYFPHVADVKVYQANLSHLPKGGLQELADSYGIARYGAQHQAGSDARLTGEVFFKILQDDRLSRKVELQNLIFGLNYGQGTNLWVPTQQLSSVGGGSGSQETELTGASINANGVKGGAVRNGVVGSRTQDGVVVDPVVGTSSRTPGGIGESSSTRDEDSASSCGSTCSSSGPEGVAGEVVSGTVAPSSSSSSMFPQQQQTRPESTLSNASGVQDGATSVVY